MNEELEYDEDRGPTPHYRDWLNILNEDVIQGEYGYEPGEFTAFPSLWHSSYAEGLTPLDAFKRALSYFAKETTP